MEEYSCCLAESFLAFGGEISAFAALSDVLFHLRVALQIVGKGVCHVAALRHDAHAVGDVLHHGRHQKRIVCASEDDGVDERVETHELVDALLHEVVGAGRVGFACLHDGCPQRTSHSADGDVGEELLYLKFVRLALYGSFGGEYADVTRRGEIADGFGGGSDNAEDATVGVEKGEVALLDGPQRFGGGCVTSEDDKVATH